MKDLPPSILGGVSTWFAEIDLSQWEVHQSLKLGFAPNFLPKTPARPEGHFGSAGLF